MIKNCDLSKPTYFSAFVNQRIHSNSKRFYLRIRYKLNLKIYSFLVQIFGFGDVLLWVASIWFEYNQTKYHKSQLPHNEGLKIYKHYKVLDDKKKQFADGFQNYRAIKSFIIIFSFVILN